MFCVKCGAEITEDANFCEYCGAAVRHIKDDEEIHEENIIKDVKSVPTLPKGISRTPEGILFWGYTGKAGMFSYYLTEEKGEIYKLAKQSKMKSLFVELLDLADMFGDVESERAELPSELLHSQLIEEKAVIFADVMEVNGEPQSNRIGVVVNNESYYYYVTDEQYDFVYDFIRAASKP